MSILFIISIVLFLYETASLLLPLKVALCWKAAGALLLLAAAFKNMIYQWLGGGMFFAPELPRWVMLTGSLLYNLLVVALFLLLLKDALWLLWRLFLRRPFPASPASWAVLIAACALTFWGTWEAVRVPDVAEYDFAIPDLPTESDGLRAAVLVDLHASALNRRPFIEAVVEKANALSPDIILIPGDFVDGLVRDRKDDLEPLSRLSAPLGVWGVSGNHEYYSGYGEWAEQLEKFGVRLLENRHVVIGDGFVLAGVPDQQGRAFGFAAPDPAKALEGAPAELPAILMAHRPEAARENAREGFVLQLSGHTHGGMMPVLDQLVARFNGGYVRGWYDVGKMKLYVSPGTSLWNGFPMRLNDPAEITLLTLRRE